MTDSLDELRARMAAAAEAMDFERAAVLRVDEQGLEGAAATAAVVSLTAAAPPSRPVVVRLDRPFLLLVRHRRSGEVYFLARVADPGR